MDEQDFIDYFTDIATRLKEIAHDPANKVNRFFIAEEFQNSMRSKVSVDEFVMTATNEDGQLMNFAADATEYHNCTFWIVRKLKNQDYPSIIKNFDDCLKLCRKVVSKMRFDNEELVGIMKHLDMEQLDFRKIETKGDNFFGYEVSFRITAKNDCEFNYTSEDWLA
jgi:hypothetical protein